MRFRAILEDHTGAFWLGATVKAWCAVANGIASRFTTSDGLRNNGIHAFVEDRDHNVWIGTTSGLSRWDGSRFRNYYLEDGLSYGWIRALVADQYGDLLVGTERGLNRLQQWQNCVRPGSRGTQRDRIWSIFPKARTHSGLECEAAVWLAYGTEGSRELRRRKGLPSNSIFQVIGDEAGRLWMSGPLGISSASFADLNAAADGKVSSIAVFSYEPAMAWNRLRMNGGFQPSGSIGPKVKSGSRA